MSQLIIPPGKATGCLRRATKFGTCCKPLADEIETIDRDKWAGLIGNVSLRPHVNGIMDQNGYGACACYATTQALHITRNIAGHPYVFLNALSMYRVTSGGRDSGSSIDEDLQFARDVGLLPADYWPESKGFRETPPAGWQDVAKNYRIQEFFDLGSIDEVGTALLCGMPVVFGWQGHSVILVELLSSTKALYCNSWGADWNSGGYGEIALSSINFGYGAFCPRTALSFGGPNPPTPT